MNNKIKIFLVCLACFLFFSSKDKANCDEYKLFTGVIHLDSTISGGKLPPDEMARIAHDAGVEIAVFTDHDTMRWEYGLPPLRKFIRKVVEKGSIHSYGEANYINTISGLNQKYPDMLIMHGAEAIPFYWWKGSYFTKDLEMMDGHKHILVMGLNDASDYKNLPSIGKGYPRRISSDTLVSLWPLSFFVFGWLLFSSAKEGVVATLQKTASVICLLMGIILTINNFPFSSPRYDQYHGDRGIAPYQTVIDYVNSRGGVTFWAHPEVEDVNKEAGGVKLITKPYHEDLLKAQNYTGFAAFAEGIKYMAPPGGVWDQILNQYCKGERERPVWAIGEVDFGDEYTFSIKDSQTIFLLKEKNEKAVIEALKVGRVYAAHLYGEKSPALVLDTFIIEDTAQSSKAYMGEELKTDKNPQLKIHVSLPETAKDVKYKIDIIRSGEVIHRFESTGNTEMIYEDKYVKPGEKIYYRLDIDGPSRILSNPIFVKFGSPSGNKKGE
ncbi:MAG: hypothetical protein Q6358_05920 [Candidatus Brocadiales bacterium]|nr:hypothetical protein [Candidatus Brocadiales bacterium]